ncbi:hypothetical protein BDZ85DRAFT_305761 [Elsinoe ampelina]|uniref:HCP-like protein n=1 Tax=Elsinoe ampelina TaxID=302913 RepID=A0A6A6GLR7_9PEZI|nr:hypothetical protein BDZ85DRAFT_305761 [Elsinoe ampelina]
MTLRDLLKKKHDIEKNGHDISAKSSDEKAVPYQTEFTFLRTTTSDQEVIQPPSYPGDQEKVAHKLPAPASPDPSRKRRSFFHPKRSSSPPSGNPPPPASVHLPTSPAPDPIPAPLSPDVLSAKKSNPLDSTALTQQEAQWEARATQLALSSAVLPNASRTPSPNPSAATSSALRGVASQIGSTSDEETLHRAITLHETGELAESTALFGLLASPSGANSALAQVLYGLALRHGWGCAVSPEEGVHFLSLAAKNSAGVESQALKAGMHRGGAAKGELVLAIFELANCYRYGWGVGKDARAAREFYETAANLGDLDAMEEAAWCFMEGFGGGKDKGVAARYLRRAEEGGRKRVGESWIWKEKYNPK